MSTPEDILPLDPESLVVPSDAYTVVSIAQTSEVDGVGHDFPILEITFLVTGHPGLFTKQVVIVPRGPDERMIDLTADVYIINAIYDL